MWGVAAWPEAFCPVSRETAGNEPSRTGHSRKRQNLHDIVDQTPKAGLALGFSKSHDLNNFFKF